MEKKNKKYYNSLMSPIIACLVQIIFFIEYFDFKYFNY